MAAARSSLGIDVSERHGLDLVLLDGSAQPAAVARDVRLDHLARMVGELEPDVVAVDAPSGWGKTGGSRQCERELRALGIQSYGTPSDPARRELKFYGWMKVGVRTFETLAGIGYPLYRGGPVPRTSIEVFPHATSVVLAGCLPASSLRPAGLRAWRARVLEKAGVATAGLRTRDAVDAALAALTGLLALRGDFVALGRPEDGLLVVPAGLAEEPYRRCAPEASDAQALLPGLAPCACGDPGCRAVTNREFAPGHDAKRKALLWQRARQGRDALEELQRRRWEAPPELRGRRQR